MLRAGLWIGAVLLTLVGIGVWAAVRGLETPETPTQAGDLSTVSISRPASRTETMSKAVVPTDPQERAAFDKAHLEQWAADIAKQAEQGRARAAVWQGCEFRPTAQPESKEEYARQKEAAEWLSAVEPAPQSRTEYFQLYLTAEGYHHVGWDGSVAEVADLPDGQRIQLLVRPKLNTISGHFAFTNYTYRETWHRDASGRMSLEKGESGGGLGGVLVD
jgi:hypothetical protein